MAILQIDKFVTGRKPAEIYQTVAIQFAFLSDSKDGYRQCHEFIRCRDFLQDCVFATVNKCLSSIWGFTYDYKVNPPLDLNHMKMLIKNPPKLYDKPLTSSDIEKATKSALKLLNHYEKMAGLPMSIAVDATDGTDDFKLFIGPKRWMESSVLVSLYSFLIRLGYKNLKFKTNKGLVVEYKKLIDDTTKSENDIRYLKSCYDKMDVLMKNQSKLFSSRIEDNYPKGTSTGSLHDRGGVYSLCCFNMFNKDLVERFKKLCGK